jgi:hypothetical protein
MSVKRIPVTFGIGGLALKLLLILVYPRLQWPEIVTVALTWDPVAVAFANWAGSHLFDLRGIAPAPGYEETFETVLVIGFGIECFCLGVLVRWIWPHLTARAGAHLRPPTSP